jgi:hypothetical protein
MTFLRLNWENSLTSNCAGLYKLTKPLKQATDEIRLFFKQKQIFNFLKTLFGSVTRLRASSIMDTPSMKQSKRTNYSC